MKQCLARLLLLVFPATILLIVAGLWLARQTRFSPVILNLRDRDTRQGQVSLWDVSAGRMVSVLGYNRPGEALNWAWPVFSAAGLIAYRRGDYPPMRIGVSEAIHWRPVEFLAVRPRGTENIRLTWLPAGSGLLVSYTRDVRGLGLEALVGRQLLDLSAGLERAALIDWPFLCDRLIKTPMSCCCAAHFRTIYVRQPPSIRLLFISPCRPVTGWLSCQRLRASCSRLTTC